MKILKTGFSDLLIISNETFNDERGYFRELFRKDILEKHLGYKLQFCQENFACSNLNVLRGLHYQIEPFAQSKLISISSGKILDIAVDIRKNSNTYGKYFSYILSEENNESIFIPKGFAHGYLSLSKKSTIHYKVDNYYVKSKERGISFDDSFLNINWGIEKSKLILSEKDLEYKKFKW